MVHPRCCIICFLHPTQITKISSQTQAVFPKQLKISSSRLAFPARCFLHYAARPVVLACHGLAVGQPSRPARRCGGVWNNARGQVMRKGNAYRRAEPLLYGLRQWKSGSYLTRICLPHGRSQYLCPRMKCPKFESAASRRAKGIERASTAIREEFSNRRK